MTSAGGIRAGRAFVELAADDRFSAAVKQAQSRLQEFADGAQALGQRLAVIGGAGVAAFAASAAVFARVGDAVDKMSQRTGLGAEAISELGYAASLSGTSIERLEAGVRTMQMRIGEAQRGSTSATEAIEALGLSVVDLAGQSTSQQFGAFADVLASIGNSTERAAAAMRIFGEAGQQLLPLLSTGSVGIARMGQEARALGLVLDADAAASAAKLTDGMETLRRVVANTAVRVGEALAPAFTTLVRIATDAVVVVNRWIAENRGLVVAAAAGSAAIVGIGGALVAVGVAAKALTIAYAGLAAAKAAVTAAATAGSAAMLGLPGIIIAAAGAALYFSGALDGVASRARTAFGGLLQFVEGVFAGIADAIASGNIDLAIEIVMAAAEVAFRRGVATLQEIWYSLPRALNAIWSSVQAAFFIAVGAIREVWAGLVRTMTVLWTRMGQSVQEAWERVTSYVAKLALRIQGIFDSSLDTDAAVAAVDADLASRIRDINADADSRIADSLKAEADRIERARDETLTALAGIGERFEAEDVARRARIAEQLDGANARLDEASQRLADRIAEAQRPQATPESSSPEIAVPGLEGVADRIEVATAALSQRGLFSASVIGRQGFGDAIANRQLAESQKTNTLVQRLVDRAESSEGLTFD